MSLQRLTYGLAAVAGVAVLAAGCGGSSSGGNTAKVGTGSGANASTAATVTTHSGPAGVYLTDGKGRTLYMFSKDTGTTSNCTGDCTKEWPPFTTSGTPSATGSAQSSMLGTTARSGGITQVTYAGHPLYYYLDDESAGDMKGEGATNFGGLWTALAADGSSIAASKPSSQPSSSGGCSSSEWG